MKTIALIIISAAVGAASVIVYGCIVAATGESDGQWS